MPQITIFDGVAKFAADSSNLDEFIVKLEQGLPSASEKAAAATVLLKEAQANLKAALAAVTAEGGQTAENMTALAEAENNYTLASQAARIETQALKTSLAGVKEESGLVAETTTELGGELVKLFGIMALAEGAKSLIENTQKSVLGLELLSEKTGIAIDTLAGLKHVAEANGVSFDAVGMALTRLSRAQELAIEGGKQQIVGFQRIGISATELKQLSPEQLFYRVADAMSNASSHGAAAASAFALLGRGGAELIPILRQGAEALKEHVDEAAKASGVTSDAGKAAKDYEAQMANLAETVQAAVIPAMEFMVPLLQTVESVIKSIGAVTNTVLVGLSTLAKAFTSLPTDALGHLGEGAAQIKALWGNLGDDLGKIWQQSQPLKPINDDLDNLGKKDAKALQEWVKNQEARVDAAKAKGDALAALELQQGRLALVGVQNRYFQEGQLQGQFEQQAYERERSALAQKLAIAQQGGEKSKEQVIKLQADIEKLDDQHKTKIIKSYVDLMNKLHDEQQKIPLVTAPIDGTIVDQSMALLQKVKDAAAGLGITFSVNLKEQIETMKDNLVTLKNSGVASIGDILQAQIALNKAQIQYNQLLPIAIAETKKYQDELNQNQDAFNKLTGTVDKTGKATHDWSQQFKIDLSKGVSGMDDLSTMGTEAFNQLGQGVESAFASAITGQKAFGAALEEALQKSLATLASQAAVKALFYTAEGFAALAGFSTVSASEFFNAAGIMAAVAGVAGGAAAAMPKTSSSSGSSSSSSSSGGTAPAAQAPQNPVQVTNVQHFAAGGLVSGPTLAVIGDSINGGGSKEAVLPLSDRNAMSQIAAAIAANMPAAGGGQTVNIEGLISSDNLNKVMRKMNRQVNRGQARLVASNSFKLTRKV